MAEKTNAIRLLENGNVPFRFYEYDVSDGRIDALSIAEKINRTADEVFKTLVAEAPGHEYFVFVVPAASELDLKKAARAANRKSIELIPQKQLLPLTGYIHGGCSPLGMKKLFPTFIDESAVLFETICVSGGRVGLNLALHPEELAGLVNAEFADIAK
jgi:Cys-tRNA(Pro)/Cys-tRNA(Cys) deacylase